MAKWLKGPSRFVWASTLRRRPKLVARADSASDAFLGEEYDPRAVIGVINLNVRVCLYYWGRQVGQAMSLNYALIPRMHLCAPH